MVRCKVVGMDSLRYGDQEYKAGDIADLPEEIVKTWGLPLVADEEAPAPDPEPTPEPEPVEEPQPLPDSPPAPKVPKPSKGSYKR